MVATGRPLRWLDVLDAVKDAHPLVIVSNGAGLYDVVEGLLVESRPLRRPVLDALATDLRTGIPGVGSPWNAATSSDASPDGPPTTTTCRVGTWHRGPICFTAWIPS